MFKHIIDETLELRPISTRDINDFFNLIDQNRQYLREWLPWVDGTISPEDTRGFIEGSLSQYSRNKGFQAGIWYQNNIVGVIGLHDINWFNKNTSLGYWLAEGVQGKGIMTRACQAIINHVFNDLKLERVEIRCADQNYKSQAVPKRLGFTNEGICRNAENLYGHFVDLFVFSILKDEWQQK